MKKLLFLCAITAIAALGTSQAARATGFTITDSLSVTNTVGGNIVVKSDSGTTDLEYVTVKNNSTCTNGTGTPKCSSAPASDYDITLTSIQVWVGGTGQDEATNTPPTGYTDYFDDTATPYSHTDTGDVTVSSGNTKDQLTSAALTNSSSDGFCYVGEVLGQGASCEIEVVVDETGAAPTGHGNSDLSDGKTDIFTTVNGNGLYENPENSATYNVEVDYAPEPASLVLLGSGFGLLGLGLYFRRRIQKSGASMSQPTIA